MRKRGVVILMAAALTASVPATALADQVAGQIALNGEAASEDVVDEESPVDMDQTEEADDENHEESEDAGLEETDEAEAGTEESDPEESEPEESEEEVKEAEKSDESGESENEDADSAELESKEDELEDEVVDETELADELQKEPSKAPEEESGDMPEIGTEEFTAWFKKNCNEDFLWEMLAEHVEDDTFFTWAVEHDKLYYKAFKSYQKILEKDGQPDEKISSEVDAETEENMAVLDEEVEELT